MWASTEKPLSQRYCGNGSKIRKASLDSCGYNSRTAGPVATFETTFQTRFMALEELETFFWGDWGALSLNAVSTAKVSYT